MTNLIISFKRSINKFQIGSNKQLNESKVFSFCLNFLFLSFFLFYQKSSSLITFCFSIKSSFPKAEH